MRLQSLRARLIVIILTPLMLIALIAAGWQFRNAVHRAEDIFDRGLLSAAVAIARDTAVSGGDALAPATRQVISDTSGGELFYHVHAPDGVFVTGYATPPVPPPGVDPVLEEPLFYTGRYQGRDVRVLRFQDAMNVDGLSGLFTVTVWQNMAVREGFVRDVALRAFGVIAVLVVSVALVVWFGVRLGLRPLLDLQEAIARRSPSDLDPIRRKVPMEIRGIVVTLNRLLDRVSRSISSKDEFIANAAHQLRNPVAGVQALAEAVESAPTAGEAQIRAARLTDAARELSHLTNQLLSFERAGGHDIEAERPVLRLDDLARSVVDRFRAETTRDVTIAVSGTGTPLFVRGDPVMLQEALINLLDNAVLHGGPALKTIELELAATAGLATLTISDDGVGIAPEDREAATTRFGQINAGPGSGLGLPIAARVAENHGGRLAILERSTGAAIRLEFPLSAGT